jgi:hypothetical protein
MTGFDGYNLRVGVVSNAATDDKSWYGLQLFGTSDKATAPQLEWQPMYGFAARPKNANTDGTGCNAVYSFDGGFSWLIHDPRYNDKIPPLTEGSSAMWNYEGLFLSLDAVDKTLTAYIPRGTSAHSFVMGQSSAGAELVELKHSSGAYINLTTSDGVMLRGVGNAFVNIQGDEISLNGAVTTTASITVGGVAGQPLVNATNFNIVLGTMVTALNALTPITPYEIGLHAALLAMVASFPLTCSTQMIKAI